MRAKETPCRSQRRSIPQEPFGAVLVESSVTEGGCRGNHPATALAEACVRSGRNLRSSSCDCDARGPPPTARHAGISVGTAASDRLAGRPRCRPAPAGAVLATPLLAKKLLETPLLAQAVLAQTLLGRTVLASTLLGLGRRTVLAQTLLGLGWRALLAQTLLGRLGRRLLAARLGLVTVAIDDRAYSRSGSVIAFAITRP